MSAKPAKKNKSKKSDKNEKENETEGTTKTVDSDRGKISFVMIPDGKTGKDALESIKGKDAFVDFQKRRTTQIRSSTPGNSQEKM